MPAHGANGRWVFIPDDDRPDQPHDDAKDHDPCPECNPKRQGQGAWMVSAAHRAQGALSLVRRCWVALTEPMLHAWRHLWCTHDHN